MSHVRMGKEILTFGDIELAKKKKEFYYNTSPVPLKDIHIEKILVSKKISSGKKTLNTLNDNKVKPLHIIVYIIAYM